ncbi:hypothetical protein [Xenophilus azovorans]|uniref:hypothetical protein n=1 Tax=Xenophilus azovorans TaxID=151755 RepID=UPI00056EF19B|nr:hypothetical protein [Xenophilus azovorans]
MHRPATLRAPAARALMPVSDLGDIEYLVKESEVLTGRAGRCFVVAGADRLTYRVHWHPLGFKVERLDEQGCVLDRRHLLPWEFETHSVAQALASGQLFTASVSSAMQSGI